MGKWPDDGTQLAGEGGAATPPPPCQVLRLLRVRARASLTLAGCAWHLPPWVQMDLLLPAPFPVSGRQCWHAAVAPSVWPEAPAAATGASRQCPRPMVRSSTTIPALPEPRSLRQGPPARPGKRPHPPHPTLQTTDKYLGQLKSNRNAGERRAGSRNAWGREHGQEREGTAPCWGWPSHQ